ncbi:MAG TPA: GMC family oxidoreductase N-terminal domain-containing protein [Blastocatellia bacterium]|nr:GMC family oxidoreductase N-terminal domain-containing protein [Blastocatellia bacterium]
MRDVIVAGAGGGGAVIAKELAARGLDVLLLEAGARFADPERNWDHFESDANNPFSGYFRFGPADRSKPGWARELPQSTLFPQISGVGGTTNHYQGNSPRAMPGVFLGFDGPNPSVYDTAHLFPFAYRELRPYYEWVEETLPVQTAPMGTKEEVFFTGAQVLGLPVQTTRDITRAAFRPQQNAILQPGGTAGKTDDAARLRFPQAKGCTFCGHCSQGCFEPRGAPINLKAKRSTSVSYIPMALTCDLWSRSGNPVTLISDAFAVRVNMDSDHVAKGITWRIGATGEVFTEEAVVVVLACGTVENPRLWLNSGLPNPNGWVGMGLTDHFVDAVTGVMPFYTGSTRGPGSAGRIDLPGYGMLEVVGETPGLRAGLSAFSDAGIAGFYDNGLPGGGYGADTVGRLVGRELKDAMSNVDRLLNIDVFTDDDVEAQNRVMLSTNLPPDEHGPVPRIEIHHRNRSARTVRNREFLVQQAVQLLRALGATKVHRINKPPFVIHSHSTMRMGLSVNDSVLDENGEARWVRHLFIADNSALANGLGSVNPTLTTQALATRTAERIFQQYFRADPWVHCEAPVSSIDPAVTRAVIERGL